MSAPVARSLASLTLLRTVIAWALAFKLAWYGVTLLALGPGVAWDSQVYEAAKSVPGGGVTWGVTALVPPALIVAGYALRRKRATIIGLALGCLWLGMFATSWAAGVIVAGATRGILPVGIYLSAAVIAGALAVVEHATRHDPPGGIE